MQCGGKKIEAALLAIVGSIHEKQEKKLSTILETQELQLSPNTLLKAESKFPKLVQYGIPLENQQAHQALLRDLYYVCRKSSPSLSNSISLELKTGEERLLVLLPRATNFKNMVRNENEGGWFTELMKAVGGGGNNAEARTIQFLCHILARNHKEIFLEAVRQTGTQLIEPLDPVATFALQSVCNLPTSKMKLLKRFLEAEVGTRIFSSPREVKQVFGMDSVVPITEVFHYAGSAKVVDPRSREKIPWMYKGVKDIVRLLIQMQVRDLREDFDWNHLDISTCIDHGKGFLRATLICVLRKLVTSGTGSSGEFVCKALIT